MFVRGIRGGPFSIRHLKTLYQRSFYHNNANLSWRSSIGIGILFMSIIYGVSFWFKSLAVLTACLICLKWVFKCYRYLDVLYLDWYCTYQVSLFLTDNFQFFSFKEREIIAQINETFQARSHLWIFLWRLRSNLNRRFSIRSRADLRLGSQMSRCRYPSKGHKVHWKVMKNTRPQVLFRCHKFPMFVTLQLSQP